jgi:hypothetical protein
MMVLKKTLLSIHPELCEVSEHFELNFNLYVKRFQHQFETEMKKYDK